MTDQIERELQEAAEAAQLIENPAFRKAMDAIEKELDDLTLSIPTTDQDLCADVIRRRQVFESLKMKIVTFIKTGKLANQTAQERQPIETKFER